MRNLNFVPEPILFNGLKHHLGCIRKFIDNHAIATTQALAQQLLCLGESQMDVYMGSMSPIDIAHDITLQLQQMGRLEKKLFTALLNEKQMRYATLQLSDGTNWVLRLGELEDRYIHIHPGRYAAHTIRVKAGALKTAIAVNIWKKKQESKEITLAAVNQIRKEILNASPIKSISWAEGIGKLIQLIDQY